MKAPGLAEGLEGLRSGDLGVKVRGCNSICSSFYCFLNCLLNGILEQVLLMWRVCMSSILQAGAQPEGFTWDPEDGDRQANLRPWVIWEAPQQANEQNPSE